MNRVTVKHAPVESMILFYGTRPEGQADTARNLLQKSAYIDGPVLDMDKDGEDAAEEVFDLSNNPSRQNERVQMYGRGPSLSVGDIVTVNGRNFLCASMGWTEI